MAHTRQSAPLLASFCRHWQKSEYDSLAPNPQHWPKLVEKLKKLDETVFDWKAETIRSIKAPILVIIGDSDIVRPEHAVQMFQLFGGGVAGDLASLPNSQLAVLPGIHHVGVIERSDWLLTMIPPFLDEPISESQKPEAR
jgi:pimeloyl-ACP methyl ester carboxylesterase